MPYNFTHALVGLTALEQSNDAVRALIAANQGEFLAGTMGPDPFFGDSRPKPLFSPCHLDAATRLHALDARDLFAAMFPLSGTSDAQKAYTLGFLCHFLLDTNAHPYIEARFPGALHTPAEIQIDLMMADRIGRADVPQKPRIFYRIHHLKELAALHRALSVRLFSIDIDNAFARSWRKWIAVNTISYDPANRKLRFFGALERLLGIPGKLTGFLVARHSDPEDRLNLNHAVWRAPWKPQAPRTESFAELFQNACAEAPGLMNAALFAMETGDDCDALALIGARRMDATPV